MIEYETSSRNKKCVRKDGYNCVEDVCYPLMDCKIWYSRKWTFKLLRYVSRISDDNYIEFGVLQGNSCTNVKYLKYIWLAMHVCKIICWMISAREL